VREKRRRVRNKETNRSSPCYWRMWIDYVFEQKKCLYLLEEEKLGGNVTGYDTILHLYLNYFYVCIWLWQPQNIRKWRWEVENILVELYVDYGIHHAKYNQNIPRDRCLFPIQISLTLTITGFQYKQYTVEYNKV